MKKIKEMEKEERKRKKEEKKILKWIFSQIIFGAFVLTLSWIKCNFSVYMAFCSWINSSLFLCNKVIIVITNVLNIVTIYNTKIYQFGSFFSTSYVFSIFIYK